MTYEKPKGVTYTDMCIYIDNHIYEPSFDENLIYEYLYHIVLMLAKKSHLFQKHYYYDYFAIYGANRVYFRLTNKKQWELNANGEGYKLERIKSVLNYIKNILYPLKVDFEQSEYCQSISKEAYTDEVDYNFNNLLNSYVNKLVFCEFNLLFNDIGKTCKAFLQTIPYKPNSSEWLNIYISVMLTFLNNVTLTNRQKKRIEHLTSTNRLTEDHIVSAYDEQSNRAILFHLPEHMNDYIIVLVRQLKNLIAKDLCEILNTKVSHDIQLTSSYVQDYVDSYKESDNEY